MRRWRSRNSSEEPLMRVTIQALVDREDDEPPTTVELGAVERNSSSAPSSGLGLFIRETHDLLQQLQSVVLAGTGGRVSQVSCLL